MEHQAEISTCEVELVDDPLSRLSDGTTIWQRTAVFGVSGAGIKPAQVRNWGYFDGALLAVGFVGQGRLDIHGSAVMVAPGLAITAAHVLHDSLDAMNAGLVDCICVGIRHNRAADAWRLKSVTFHDGDGDLAWLSLDLASAVDERWFFSSVAMSTRTPRVGEDLTIAGFRFDASNDAVAPRSFPPLEGQLVAAAGKVQEIFVNRRDRVLVPFPAIAIACGSVGSMSGGAVLDSTGLLVGVVSTGFDTDSREGPTHAAWIIHALALRPELQWPPGLYEPGAAVLELPETVCHIVGRDAMPLLEDGGVDYRAW